MRVTVRLASLVLAAQICATAQAPASAGRRQFEAHCAGCHGADGEGGEHGPNIVDARHPRTRSPEGLQEIIRDGIRDAGMPAFQLPEPDLRQLLAFVVSLTAPAMS